MEETRKPQAAGLCAMPHAVRRRPRRADKINALLRLPDAPAEVRSSLAFPHGGIQRELARPKAESRPSRTRMKIGEGLVGRRAKRKRT